MKQQLKEINGKADKYHNERYQQLVKTVAPLRQKFRKERSLAGRVQIAAAEFGAWKGYLDSRKEQIASEMPEYHIDPKTLSMLKDQFDRLKHRETIGVPGPELIDFHAAFANKFPFTVPIHPRNLAQMIHPHQGYLAAMTKHFRFEDLVQVYHNQIAASLERATGRDLLADELSCLSFWLAHTEASHMDFEGFAQLMGAFRFKVETREDFDKEFGYTLHHAEGEFRGEDEVYRFDFARRIFLERGL